MDDWEKDVPPSPRERYSTWMLDSSNGRSDDESLPKNKRERTKKVEKIAKSKGETIEHKMTRVRTRSPLYVNPKSYCDVCRVSPLTPTYYHCTVCKNYDLCEGCEKQNDELIAKGKKPLHDPFHVCIKYRTVQQ